MTTWIIIVHLTIAALHISRHEELLQEKRSNILKQFWRTIDLCSRTRHPDLKNSGNFSKRTIVILPRKRRICKLRVNECPSMCFHVTCFCSGERYHWLQDRKLDDFPCPFRRKTNHLVPVHVRASACVSTLSYLLASRSHCSGTFARRSKPKKCVDCRVHTWRTPSRREVRWRTHMRGSKSMLRIEM